MKKTSFLAVFLLFLLPGLASARQMPLVDPEPINIPAGMPQASAVAAIKAGLAARQWNVLQEKPGWMRATVIASGDVQATVDVVYDAQKVQIKYVASKNLDERGSDSDRSIGSRYINWSRNLTLSITQALLQQPISK